MMLPSIDWNRVVCVPRACVPRFEITDPRGKVYCVYATDSVTALRCFANVYTPQWTITPEGYWDPALSMVVDGLDDVHVEGDVWARPQKKKATS